MKKDCLLIALSLKIVNELNFKILKLKDNEKPRRHFLLTSVDIVVCKFPIFPFIVSFYVKDAIQLHSLTENR